MWTLPNILTVARIVLAPVVALLPFITGSAPKIIAFFICLVAAIGDAVDGYLARSRNQVTDFGKLVDPLADKLLLIAALVPIFWLTRHPTLVTDYKIPWWGSLPVWVALLLVGREVAMTAFRQYAKRRGVVIAAMGPGKVKAVFQNIFIAATILWFAWKDLIVETRLAGAYRDLWSQFHGTFVSVTLAVAVVLTAYSLVVYLYRYRDLLKASR